jgi:hypothetical protein
VEEGDVPRRVLESRAKNGIDLRERPSSDARWHLERIELDSIERVSHLAQRAIAVAAHATDNFLRPLAHE